MSDICDNNPETEVEKRISTVLLRDHIVTQFPCVVYNSKYFVFISDTITKHLKLGNFRRT